MSATAKKPKGWKPATSTERGRASILEQRARISPGEAKWLADFRRMHPKRGSGVYVVDEQPPPAPPSSTTSSTTPEPTPAPAPPADVDVDEDPEVELELDDEDDLEAEDGIRTHNAPPTSPAAIECDIPDCSACRTMRGAMICKVTGRATYPRLSDEGAEMLASVGAGAVHLFARTTRRDAYAPRPTPTEKARLAKGVKMVADRRFPQAGAIDDVLVLAHAFMAYGHRALSEPAPQRPTLQPQAQQQQPTAPPASSPAPATSPDPQPLQTRMPDPATESEQNADDDFNDAAIERELKRGEAQVH